MVDSERSGAGLVVGLGIVVPSSSDPCWDRDAVEGALGIHAEAVGVKAGSATLRSSPAVEGNVFESPFTVDVKRNCDGGAIDGECVPGAVRVHVIPRHVRVEEGCWTPDGLTSKPSPCRPSDIGIVASEGNGKDAGCRDIYTSHAAVILVSNSDGESFHRRLCRPDKSFARSQSLYGCKSRRW